MTRVRLGQPIGIDVFEYERRLFLSALRDLLADPAVNQGAKVEAIVGTLSAVAQMAALSPFTGGDDAGR